MIKLLSHCIQCRQLTGSIPKIIHQIWDDRIEPLPERYVHLSETWKQHYPEWHYILWDSKRIDDFIEVHYPQYLDMYRSFFYHEQRWNVIRYLILNKIGGMYVDFDYESIKSMNELLKDKTCCFSMEPESHCQYFNKPIVFNNALMLSIPGHSFMQKIIKTVFSKDYQKSVIDAKTYHADETNRKKQIILHSTGTSMLLGLYNQLSEKEKNYVYLIPSNYVTPFDFKQAYFVVRGVDTEELNQCLNEAYAVYYFLEFWKNDNEFTKNLIIDFNFLQPINISGKIRIGNRHDGGYIVYQPALYETDVLITYGVGWDVAFEVNFHELTGKKVWMYDPTMFDVNVTKSDRYIDRINQWKQKLNYLQEQDIIFRDEGISTIQKPKYNTFENHLKENKITNEKILFKMDIEGDEYSILEDSCFYENLQSVNQMIIEFHDLKNNLRRLKYLSSF